MSTFSTADYTTLAGLIVLVLGHFGVTVASNDVITVLADLVVLFGIGKKYFDHKAIQAQLVGAGIAPKA